MKVENVSSRPHWVGNVLIAPGATEEIAAEWESAINKDDLKVVEESEEPKKRGRPAKAVEEPAAAEDEGEGSADE